MIEDNKTSLKWREEKKKKRERINTGGIKTEGKDLVTVRVSKCHSLGQPWLCPECDKVARPVVKYFSGRSSELTSHIKKCCKLEAYFLSTYQGWSFRSLTI